MLGPGTVAINATEANKTGVRGNKMEEAREDQSCALLLSVVCYFYFQH